MQDCGLRHTARLPRHLEAARSAARACAVRAGLLPGMLPCAEQSLQLGAVHSTLGARAHSRALCTASNSFRTAGAARQVCFQHALTHISWQTAHRL